MNKDELEYLVKYKILKLKNYMDIDFNLINWKDNPYEHTSWIFIVHKLEYLLDLTKYYINT
ncbi:hypothetical protein ITK70_001605, partial [Campylobacter lari]|nr:hypothetical protein [Campylobacter lari]